MSHIFHDLDRQKLHAQACADESGEAWCVCQLFGKYFCRPERRALSMKQKTATAQIVETCEPEGDS